MRQFVLTLALLLSGCGVSEEKAHEIAEAEAYDVVNDSARVAALEARIMKLEADQAARD